MNVAKQAPLQIRNGGGGGESVVSDPQHEGG